MGKPPLRILARNRRECFGNGLLSGCQRRCCQRWHVHHHTTGTGHLYQGRCKSFPGQTDAHCLTDDGCVWQPFIALC